jgi:hypothetical protein
MSKFLIKTRLLTSHSKHKIKMWRVQYLCQKKYLCNNSDLFTYCSDCHFFYTINLYSFFGYSIKFIWFVHKIYTKASVYDLDPFNPSNRIKLQKTTEVAWSHQHLHENKRLARKITNLEVQILRFSALRENNRFKIILNYITSSFNGHWYKLTTENPPTP